MQNEKGRPTEVHLQLSFVSNNWGAPQQAALVFVNQTILL